MEMMNRAIEDAADFRGMMDKITTDRNRLLLQPAEDGTPNERRFLVLPDRQPGENRAAHRARLKAERRASKVPSR